MAEGGCGRVFPHRQFSPTSWVSYDSTQFWHCPPGDSARSHRLRAQSRKTSPAPPMPVANPVCYLYFWPTGYRSEVLITPTLGSINLLKGLTELRETFYLLDHQFIMKGTARWKRCRGQGMGKAQSFLALSISPHLRVFTNPKALRALPFGFLWRLRYTSMID